MTNTTPIRLFFEDGCAVRFEFSPPPVLRMSTPTAPSFAFDVGTIIYAGVDDYDGEYEATPTQNAQTFDTGGKRMTRDFVVNPIPYYYGLITWNGSSLMVS